ncbi:MAG: nuclear transport factor 2 family protein [Lactococcus chungangensis]
MTSQHDALFAQYTQSWENKDLPQFLACLTDDIIITECYGATYISKTEAQKWFQHWTAPTENQVVNWEILAKFEDSLKNTDFFNWHFRYVYQNKASVFEGLSQVTFSDNGKITKIKEYEMAFDKTRPYLK